MDVDERATEHVVIFAREVVPSGYWDRATL